MACSMASACLAAAIGFAAPAFVAPMVSRSSAAPMTSHGAHLRSPVDSAQPAPLYVLALGAVIGAGVALNRRTVARKARNEDEGPWVFESGDFDKAMRPDAEHVIPVNFKDGIWVENSGGYFVDNDEDMWIDTEGGFGFMGAERIPGDKVVVGGSKTKAVYAQVLLDAAKNKKETVIVTKDILKLKALRATKTVNLPDGDEDVDILMTRLSEEVENIIKFCELQSTVVPALIRCLAFRGRLDMLTGISDDFLNLLYTDQGIASVIVKTVKPLSDEQAASLKGKLKIQLNVMDVKLKNVIDPKLIAGYILEHSFLDEDEMTDPTQIVDESYASKLKNVVLA